MQRKQKPKQKQNIKRGVVAPKGTRVGIVVAEFNSDITEKLLHGALSELVRSGISEKHITVVHVPGSFELPIACQRLAKTGKYDVLVALGCVIKGKTDHYYYVAGEAARGIMNVMLKHDIPIGFGLLTVNTLAEAKERAGAKIDAGASAARAALSIPRF